MSRAWEWKSKVQLQPPMAAFMPLGCVCWMSRHRWLPSLKLTTSEEGWNLGTPKGRKFAHPPSIQTFKGLLLLVVGSVACASSLFAFFCIFWMFDAEYGGISSSLQRFEEVCFFFKFSKTSFPRKCLSGCFVAFLWLFSAGILGEPPLTRFLSWDASYPEASHHQDHIRFGHAIIPVQEITENYDVSSPEGGSLTFFKYIEEFFWLGLNGKKASAGGKMAMMDGFVGFKNKVSLMPYWWICVYVWQATMAFLSTEYIYIYTGCPTHACIFFSFASFPEINSHRRPETVSVVVDPKQAQRFLNDRIRSHWRPKNDISKRIQHENRPKMDTK